LQLEFSLGKLFCTAQNYFELKPFQKEKEMASSQAEPPVAQDEEPQANPSSAVPDSVPLTQAAPVPQNEAGDAATEAIAIDSNLSDADSAFGDDASSLASLESWVQKYRMENGRRFHSFKDGAYLLPNDEKELDRLDLHHHIFTLVLQNRLHLAPLYKPRKVLDIGTGTGIWAIDFADEYPDAQVIGIDLSPVQPSWVPANIEFQIDDCEDTWTHRSKFDYIHIRSMAGSIGDWTKLLRQAYNQLQPGGWIEIQEFEVWIRSDDDSLERAPMIRLWQEQLNVAADTINKPMLVAPLMRSWLLQEGYSEVEETIIKARHFFLFSYSIDPHSVHGANI
jgi:SAM-dependent methyltransferase